VGVVPHLPESVLSLLMSADGGMDLSVRLFDRFARPYVIVV